MYHYPRLPAAEAIVQTSTWNSDHDLHSDEAIAALAGFKQGLAGSLKKKYGKAVPEEILEERFDLLMSLASRTLVPGPAPGRLLPA